MSGLRRVHALRAFCMACAVAILSACAEVGPDYVRPSRPVPAAYKTTGPTDLVSGATAPSAGRWWQIYQDPTLDALVSQVEVNNEALVAAVARVSEAQALVKAAGGASVPTVGVGTLKSGRRNENDFGIGVSWELDLWGRIRRDVEAHRATAQASESDLAAATLSIQAQLVQSYFALRENDAAIVFQQRASDANEQWQRMVANQYAQGIATSANVAQSLLRSSMSRLQLADMRASRAELEHAIAVMVGKPPAEFSIAVAPLISRVPVIPVNVPAALLERRPDVVASERRMAAASARIGFSKAQTLPSINLNAGIGVLRGPTAAADVRAPLFTGGRLQAQVDNANAGYSEAVANYRQTVLDAYREVEDGLTATSALAGAAQLLAQAATAAVESDRVTQNQYRAGIVDYPAVVDAASAALDATRGELQLRLRRLDASVNLIKALGGSWTLDIDQDEGVAR